MSKPIEMKVNVTAELLKIKDKYGSLSAENVVTEAKKKRHPLHSHFDWNDSSAAIQWRLHQARMLIATAKVYVNEHAEETVHAFVSIAEEGDRQYVYTPEAISDDEKALQMFLSLENRINRLHDEMHSLRLLQGDTKKALEAARKPIKNRRKQLQLKTKLA